MKKVFRNFPILCAAIVTLMASLFANMPCHGMYYEPELPEELRK